MRYVLTCFVCCTAFLPTTLSQQRQILVSSVTKMPIEFASVTIENREELFLTNEFGQFFLPQNILKLGDSIMFTHVSFFKKRISYESLIDADTIFLDPKEKELENVQVTRNVRLFTVKHLLRYPKGEIEESFSLTEGHQIGVILENNIDSIVQLSNLVFHFDNFPKGSVIRVRVKDVINGEVGNDLLQKKILVKLRKKRTVVDLKNMNIFLNRKEFFVGIDYVYDGDSSTHEPLNKILNVTLTDSYPRAMTYTNFKDIGLKWNNFSVRIWRKLNPPNMRMSVQVLTAAKD